VRSECFLIVTLNCYVYAGSDWTFNKALNEALSHLLQRGRRLRSVPGSAQLVLRMEQRQSIVTEVDPAVPRR